MGFCTKCGRQTGNELYCRVCNGETYEHKRGILARKDEVFCSVCQNKIDVTKKLCDNCGAEISGVAKLEKVEINKYINQEEDTLADKMALSNLPIDDDHQYVEIAERPKVKVFDEKLPEVKKSSILWYISSIAFIMLFMSLCWLVGFRSVLFFYAILAVIMVIAIITLYYFARLRIFKTEDLYVQNNLVGQFDFWAKTFFFISCGLAGLILFALVCWLLFGRN